MRLMGHIILFFQANKMQILTDAASVEVTPMLAELLAKTLEGISLQRALLGHPITATRKLK